MKMTSLSYLLITYCWIGVTMATKRLYVGGLFDLGKAESWKVIPAAKMAIEEINNRTTIPGYRLELLINDTRNGNFKEASGVHDYLNNGPRKIMLLGPVDNDIAKSIANYAGLPQNGLLQFSYGTDDLSLANDRNLYPYFFRTAISMASLDDVRVAFIKHFSHWKEVGIVYGDNLFDVQLSNQFKSRLESKGIKVLAEVRLQENDPGRVIRTIQEKDIHIIFGLFKVGLAARKLFCQAYKNGLYGPHYVWILQIASNDGWWVPNPGEDIGGCKEIEMTCQIQNYFNVKPTHGFYHKSSPFAYSNKNSSELVNDYNSRVDNGNNTSNRSSNAWLVYDAVWSIAHVLKNSLGKLSRPLENITYGDLNTSRVFYNETLKLNFESPNMQRLQYFSNGDRKFDMNIDQIVIKDDNSNPSSVNAGHYDFLSGKFIQKSINWRAGTPYRKTTNSYTTRYIHRALFGALIFLACLGLLYALVCLIIVLIYRKQPIIWNSSPIMNTIIILGCILNYITIILYAFDWTTSARVTSLCRARAWTFAIGFTLSVGGLVAKLWIAYCVLSERFVRRWKMMLFWMLVIVVVLFVLDIIIMGCWEGIDPLYAKMVVYKEQELYKCFQPISANTFKANWYTVEHCTCSHPLTWLLIILILKFMVVLFGVFLAWQTRKLYIKSLNDTQYCAFCLFVVFFFAIIGVLCALLTTKLPNLFFGLVGTIVFLCTTIILGLLYTHKVGRVMCTSKSRRGKTIFVGGGKQTGAESSCCSCCACSPACCITFCACFPCCNLYTCCRKCCCGAQVHPSQDDEKTEFYINGQPQDKEGQIAYLLKELHERDVELSRLRPANTYTSMWTQTYEEDLSDFDYTREDGDGHSMGSTNSNSSFNSRGSKMKRNSVKIFNQGADYSHVRSKVNTGIAKSSSPQKKDEKYYLGVWQARGGRPTDAEISKLRALLAEKDKEIERLTKGENKTSQPGTKITIITEDVDSPSTQEKQCQTDSDALPHKQPNVVTSPSSINSPIRKVSKGRKTSKNAPKDKVILIKQKDNTEKINQKEEEMPVTSSAEWLFGKPEEDRKNISKDRDNPKETIAVAPHEPHDTKPAIKGTIYKERENDEDNGKYKNDIDIIVVSTKPQENEMDDNENQTKDEKQHQENFATKQQEEEEKKKKEKEERQRYRRKEEGEEREEQNKFEEEGKKEEEKQRQEKRKSRFSFFGGQQDPPPMAKTPEQTDSEPTNKSGHFQNPVEMKTEWPNNGEKDRPEKSDLLNDEKPERSDSPKSDKKQGKAENPDTSYTRQEEKPENPVASFIDEQNKSENSDPLNTKNEGDPKKPDSPTNEEQGKQNDNESPTDDKQFKVLELASPTIDKTIKNKTKPGNDNRHESDEEDRVRPPQNTPASVDTAQNESKEDKSENPAIASPTDDKDTPNSNNEPHKSDDELDEMDEDDDEDEEGVSDDDGEDNDKTINDEDEDDNDNDDDDDAKGNNKRQKPRRRTKKRIGGKLNWNAESKIDNSSGYTRRNTNKIKTYKVDYSHVRSKLSSSTSTKKKDSNDAENERKYRRRVSRKRWNPSDKKK